MCADACVLAAPDETWGARLTAYVVGAREPDDDARRARRRRAGRAAVPRAWVRLEAIPHLPTGKPDRERPAASPA